MAGMTQSDVKQGKRVEAQWLRDRLAHKEREIAILHDALQDEASRRENEVRERDRVIHDLQGHIVERDHLISDLQRQLGERERRIREMEVELHRRYIEEQGEERDQRIYDLQAEIRALRASAETQARAAEREQLIRDLHFQIANREQYIRLLQRELQSIHQSKLWPHVRLVGTLRQILDLVVFSPRSKAT